MKKLRKRNILLSVGAISLAVSLWCLAYMRRQSVAFDRRDVQSVVLYDLNPFEKREYITAYTNTAGYALTPAETQLLFAQTEREPLWIWKGAFLGVVTTRNGETFHLAVSNYGGYARVLETGEPIRFVGASGREYERMRNAAHTNVFFPARLSNNRAGGF